MAIPLICPQCKNNDDSSQLVMIFSGYSKLGSFNSYVDENGTRHSHNPDMSLEIYRCSNGHEIKHVVYSSCYASGCNYRGGTDKLVVCELFEELT